MKKKGFRTLLVVLTLALVSVIPAMALDCNAVVADEAHMLNSFSNIIPAASSLQNAGADVRIRTVAPTNNLDATEHMYEQMCPSWASGSSRKSNLVVVMISKNHKAGVYYGAAWHKALDDHWNRIMTDYAIPRFRAGDLEGGLASVTEQLAKRIAASKDEALHPTESTTNVQATDMTGLWWVLGIMVFLGGGIGIFVMITKSRKEERERKGITEKERQLAIGYQSQCNSLILSLKNKFSADPPETSVQKEFDTILEDYSNIQSQSRYDLTQRDQDISIYSTAKALYKRMLDRLSAVGSAHTYTTTKNTTADIKPNPVVEQEQAKAQPYIPPQPVLVPEVTPQVIEHHHYHETVVHDNNSNDLLTGMLVGEALSRPAPERVVEYRQPEPERVVYEAPSYSHESHDDSSSSDDNSGGSVDWGSFGSSSSDSSSSDFGSSMDFGSSGDSGGGGSSDW